MKKTIKIWKFGGRFLNPKYEYIIGFKKVFLKMINSGGKILIVFSAIEGVTRLLRLLAEAKTEKINEDFQNLVISLSLSEFHRVHTKLISKLFVTSEADEVIIKFEKIFVGLKGCIESYQKGDNEDKFYASLLKFGELSSSAIMHSYICSLGAESSILFDAREYVITTNGYKETAIKKINPSFQKLFVKANILITQGFIGKNKEGEDSVLEFDGSDDSAANFAVACHGDLNFWKDVKLYREDPSINKKAEPLYEIKNSEYQEFSSHPIKPSAVDYAIKNGVKVTMKCFLCPDDYEAIILAA